MNKTLVLVLAIVILTGFGFFIIYGRNKTDSSALVPPPSVSQETAEATPQPIDLGQGGSSYLDQSGVFNLLYPNDYTLDTTDPIHPRIYKRGETQRPQSEMSDGALMVFETITLQNITLEEWVDNRIAESTKDGTSEIVEAKTSTTQNGYPGFHYSIRGLGVSENFVLQKDANSLYAVLVTYAVSDPEQRGYQNEVEAALSTLTLLK